MKILIYTFLVFFLLTFTATAQTVAKPESVLHIEVENGNTLDLKAADLTKFPRREVRAKGHDEKESVYSGYSLSDILLSAKAKIGKDEMRGKELASYLLVEAADGYKAIFAVAEIAPEFTDRIVLLANTRDGKPLDDKQGTWQIIVPGEKKHGRWVRQVAALKIKKIL